jgi:DNA (cytosine-5)-methyltransferase 1
MLPWAVYEQARNIQPDVIVCENVAEIQTWEDYNSFIEHMQGLGYTFESRELCAADFGARTSRTRWYAVLRRDGCATEWPQQTYMERSLFTQHITHPDAWSYSPWLSVRDCLDLDDWGQRISNRKKPLSDKTMGRIRHGNAKYITPITEQWIMSYYGTGVGQSIYWPLRTITCKDRFALVTHQWRLDYTYMRMLKPEELKLAQGFHRSYVIDHYSDGTRVPKAEQVMRIGNSVVPLMAQRIVSANMAA